jgi:dTDP-4-amino-4,6-dideoxygalactose transaminase
MNPLISQSTLTEPIPVTRPFLPSKKEFMELVDKIWENKWITNNGELSRELNMKLQSKLDADFFQWTSHGTSALQIAIKSLEFKGEVITTPFTYVATANSLVWENCKPVFVDIDPETLNIDAKIIEEKITDQTSGILPVHVFGYPCDIDGIQKVAKKFDLKVLYDASHTFGCEYKGKSLTAYGDAATLSFHATKAFHTVEGGGIVSHTSRLNESIHLSINHGHHYDSFEQVGINAKNSELHAAMGLINLKYFDAIVSSRRSIFELYQDAFASTRLQFLSPDSYEDFTYNYAYAPLVFPTEDMLIAAVGELTKLDIHARRYFLPSLNTLDYLNPSSCPVSESISKRILCLPLFHDLKPEQAKLVIEAVLKAISNA